MKKIQVQGVHHTTIVGSTKQSAIDFWSGVLGMKALERYPADRFSSADEFAQALVSVGRP